MRARVRLGKVTAVVLMLGILGIIVVRNKSSELTGRSLVQIVNELGPPGIVASRADLVVHGVRALRVEVIKGDPLLITNWGVHSNMVVIWLTSDLARRNIRYFYNEMKDDKSFDGGGWYSSRSLLGETARIVEIDGLGKSVSDRLLRIDAIALHAEVPLEKVQQNR